MEKSWNFAQNLMVFGNWYIWLDWAVGVAKWLMNTPKPQLPGLCQLTSTRVYPCQYRTVSWAKTKKSAILKTSLRFHSVNTKQHQDLLFLFFSKATVFFVRQVVKSESRSREVNGEKQQSFKAVWLRLHHTLTALVLLLWFECKNMQMNWWFYQLPNNWLKCKISTPLWSGWPCTCWGCDLFQ